MSSKLQWPQSVLAPSGDAYEVEAGMVLFAGKPVWSMPEPVQEETFLLQASDRKLHLLAPLVMILSDVGSVEWL